MDKWIVLSRKRVGDAIVELLVDRDQVESAHAGDLFTTPVVRISHDPLKRKVAEDA